VGTREILRRLDAHEDRTQRLLARMDERIELTRQQIELSCFEALARRQVAELRELREESRAQTQALLRVIDRMDRLEPGSGNAG
jgi:hypothetical protein